MIKILLGVTIIPKHGENMVDFDKYWQLPKRDNQDFFLKVVLKDDEYTLGSENKLLRLVKLVEFIQQYSNLIHNMYFMRYIVDQLKYLSNFFGLE